MAVNIFYIEKKVVYSYVSIFILPVSFVRARIHTENLPGLLVTHVVSVSPIEGVQETYLKMEWPVEGAMSIQHPSFLKTLLTSRHCVQ